MIQVVCWFVILSARPPAGVAAIYGVWCLFWWIGSRLNTRMPGSGVPLHSGGKTTYLEV